MRGCLCVGLLVFACFATGCSSTPRFMRKGEPGELLNAPPAGKAMVNFHRPSGWGGGADLPVYDRETLIGNTLGKYRFQYVCDPGEHIFISKKEAVFVIQARLLAGKVYDVVIDVAMGVWSPNIQIHPITKDHPRRGEIGTWEAREGLVVLVRDEDAIGYENKTRADNRQIMKDFLGGPKSDRLQKLAPDDHR